MSDYPQGDGRPDCPICNGRGVIPVLIPGGGPPGAAPCSCVTIRDVLTNVNRGWPGLTKATPLKGSILKGKTEMDLRITGSLKVFRENLRHVACRMGSSWNFKVVSDSDMMEAWLSNIGDDDVIDADVGQKRKSAVRSQFSALVDLIELPSLLIILCGVKAARNSAMPEVLLEALRHRQYLTKPTWVVDQPSYPLSAGHISWSPYVGEFLADWPFVKLKEREESVSESPKNSNSSSAGIVRFTLAEELPVSAETKIVQETKDFLSEMEALGKSPQNDFKSGSRKGKGKV